MALVVDDLSMNRAGSDSMGLVMNAVMEAVSAVLKADASIQVCLHLGMIRWF